MGNICGVKIKAKEPSDYNEIVNLVGEICGHTIPGDLIVEILCMLPVKTLIRCKSVCKAWKLLINSQVFINTHLHAKNPRYGMYALGGPEKGDSICPVAVSWIVGASNGIICLLEPGKYMRRFVLFNPSTMEYSYAPPQLFRYKRHYDTDFGFCYLPKTQEYKIVCFDRLYDLDSMSIVLDTRTITLGKTPSSREAKNVSLPDVITSDPATSGTTVFWLGGEHDSNNEIVIFYDVVEEKFGKMNAPPSPSPPPSDFVRRSLGLLKGSVIVLDNLKYNSKFFDIWMLIDDDVSNRRSWMKYRRVGPFPIGTYSIAVCWDNSWKVCCRGWSREAYESRNWFFCDIETDEVEYHCKIQRDQAEYGIINYQESLVSINNLLPCIDHVGRHYEY